MDVAGDGLAEAAAAAATGAALRAWAGAGAGRTVSRSLSASISRSAKAASNCTWAEIRVKRQGQGRALGAGRVIACTWTQLRWVLASPQPTRMGRLPSTQPSIASLACSACCRLRKRTKP